MLIQVIDLLQTTECGPEALYNNNKQNVFLNQGSIDGACGPYSILMGLLCLGVVDRNEIISFTITDGRTRTGKLRNKLNNFHSLFVAGTLLEDLTEILNDVYGRAINVDTIDKKNYHVIDFAIKHLDKNHPVIIGINYSGGGHWMLAVGYEKNFAGNPVKLLLLDPGEQESIVSSWNSIIDLEISKKGIYPYRWWTGQCYSQFHQAIAVWNK